MAVGVAGNPVAQYAPGTDFRGHATVVYMGHGSPNGTLAGVDVDALVADVAHPKHGMSPGSTLHLWSCYSARPTSVAPSLVERVTRALEHNEIDGVTVTGVPNISITDTHSNRLFSGLDENLKQENATVMAVLGHAWVECGLFDQERDVTVQGHKLAAPPAQSVPPSDLNTAVSQLIKRGRLMGPIQNMTREQKKQAMVTTFRECNRLFFQHPLVQDLVNRGLIQRAPAALTVMQSAVLTEPIERRDPAYTDYMAERRNQAESEF
jgi:hypothetical protein